MSSSGRLLCWSRCSQESACDCFSLRQFSCCFFLPVDPESRPATLQSTEAKRGTVALTWHNVEVLHPLSGWLDSKVVLREKKKKLSHFGQMTFSNVQWSRCTLPDNKTLSNAFPNFYFEGNKYSLGLSQFYSILQWTVTLSVWNIFTFTVE